MENSERLKEFEEQIESIGATGGRANPERRLLILGIVLGALGILLVLGAFLVSRNVDTAFEQRDMMIMGFLGLCLLFIGTIFYITNKLTRFFRYWLIRLIYEHRSQIDRLEKK